MSKLHYKYTLDANDCDQALPLMDVFQSFVASPVNSASTVDGTSFVACLEKWHRRCIAPFATWPNAQAFKCLEPGQQRSLLGLAV